MSTNLEGTVVTYIQKRVLHTVNVSIPYSKLAVELFVIDEAVEIAEGLWLASIKLPFLKKSETVFGVMSSDFTNKNQAKRSDKKTVTE